MTPRPPSYGFFLVEGNRPFVNKKNNNPAIIKYIHKTRYSRQVFFLYISKLANIPFLKDGNKIYEYDLCYKKAVEKDNEEGINFEYFPLVGISQFTWRARSERFLEENNGTNKGQVSPVFILDFLFRFF